MIFKAPKSGLYKYINNVWFLLEDNNVFLVDGDKLISINEKFDKKEPAFSFSSETVMVQLPTLDSKSPVMDTHKAFNDRRFTAVVRRPVVCTFSVTCTSSNIKSSTLKSFLIKNGNRTYTLGHYRNIDMNTEYYIYITDYDAMPGDVYGLEFEPVDFEINVTNITFRQ